MMISFVVAVFHNENSLKITYDQIKKVFECQLFQHTFEIIFIDDGSTDNSWNEILELRSLDNRVKAISFTRNFGQMSAMLAGFDAAVGDAVINISADLQDPVNLVPLMFDQWMAGSEIVICYRVGRSDPFLAKLFSKLAYSILRLSIPQIPRGGFDYVLIDRKAMNAFNAIDVRHRFFQGDLLWTGYKIGLIPYERQKREFGISQYNFRKKLNNFYDAVLDSSFIPIRAISILGVMTSFLGFLYSISIIFSWAKGETPFNGWAPLMMINLIIGGVIMVMLGVLGEYIWRINAEVRKKPNYLIRDKIL